MTWKSFHNRGATLRDVISVADQRCDGRLPMDVDGVRDNFRDELSLLATLQLRWHTRLAGRIERELMQQPMDLESAVVAAWRATAEEMPGIRAILDHYRTHPLDEAMARAMAKATTKERILLAVMAGRVSKMDESAAPIGAQIEERARASLLQQTIRVAADRRPTLFNRLRAALVA